MLLNPYRFGIVAPTVDPQFAYVQALLHMEGTDGGTTFVDSSIYNRSISAAGGIPTTSTTQVKYGVSAGRLVSQAIQIGSGSEWSWIHQAGAIFTLEGWFAFNSFSIEQVMFCTNNGATTSNGLYTAVMTNRIITFQLFNGSGSSFSSPIVVNVGLWPDDSNYHHIAIQWNQTLADNNLTIYIDGALQATASKTANAPSTSASFMPLKMGAYGSTPSSNYYADEIRITRDVIRYSSSFTPIGPFPNTGPLQTAIEPATYGNIRYLTNSGSTTDLSFNDTVATVFPAVVSSSAQTPFGGTSLFFDGSGRIELSASALILTENFSIQLWIYPTNISNLNMIWSQYANAGGDFGNRSILYLNASGNIGFQRGDLSATGTTVLALNTWHFLEVTRIDSMIYVFANGLPQGSFSLTGQMGNYTPCLGGAQNNAATGTHRFYGYMSPIRIVRGEGLNVFGYTTPSSPFSFLTGTAPFPASGMVAQYQFEDNLVDSINASDGSLASGSISYVTTRRGKGVLASATARISIPKNGFTYPINNWTYAAWYKESSHPAGGLLYQAGNSILYAHAGHYYDGSSDHDVSLAPPPQLNVWHLIVFTKSSTAGEVLYIDGNQVATNPAGTTGNSNSYADCGLIGGIFPAASAYFLGTASEIAVWNRVLSASEVTAMFT